MRIGLLSYRTNPHCGGQGIYVKNLSRELKNLGHRVDILSGPPNPQPDHEIDAVQIPTLDLYNPERLFRTPSLRELRHPLNLMEWLGVATAGFPEPFTYGLRIYRYLRRQPRRYDILHDNQCLAYGIWALGRSIPTVATIHHPTTIDRRLAVRAACGLVKKTQQLRWHSFVAMQKQVARTFPHIIAVSESSRKDISREFNIPRSRFHVVPNGINTELFAPMPEVERKRNRLIVTSSSETPLKGLIYLLQAVAKVCRKRPVELVVVGVPPQNGRTRRLIQDLGIAPRIRFVGRIDQKVFAVQYAKAAVAVVPSLYEGFGLPAGEAMACGVPVVSTTGGALPEVVGSAGLLVPPADVDALAAAIITLIENPALAERLGRHGYQRVRRLFTWQRAAEKTVQVYREAVRDHRRF